MTRFKRVMEQKRAFPTKNCPVVVALGAVVHVERADNFEVQQ